MVNVKVGESLVDKLLHLVKQRRIWATVLSAVAASSLVLGQPLVAGLCTAIAGSLGLHSYIKPKK